METPREAYFNRFTIELDYDDALSASHQGQCDDDVNALLRVLYVEKQLDAIGATDIAAELKEYGAWDDEELADEQANRQRLVWIAAGNIRDEEKLNYE